MTLVFRSGNSSLLGIADGFHHLVYAYIILREIRDGVWPDGIGLCNADFRHCYQRLRTPTSRL